jgi:hypothetical protein
MKDNLKELEQQLLKQLTEQEELEQQIQSQSLFISECLVKNNYAIADFNNTRYRLEYVMYTNQDNVKIIKLQAFNLTKLNILSTSRRSQYTPFKAEAPVDENYSLQEMLQELVEHFICAINGNIKIQELD